MGETERKIQSLDEAFSSMACQGPETFLGFTPLRPLGAAHIAGLTRRHCDRPAGWGISPRQLLQILLSGRAAALFLLL